VGVFAKTSSPIRNLHFQKTFVGLKSYSSVVSSKKGYSRKFMKANIEPTYHLSILCLALIVSKSFGGKKTEVFHWFSTRCRVPDGEVSNQKYQFG
jgi:hypothetical protein